MTPDIIKAPDLNVEDELTLQQIADLWAREPGKQDREKILAMLISAIFRRAFSGKSEAKDSAIDNLDFLLITLCDVRGLPDGPDIDLTDQAPPLPVLSIKNWTATNSREGTKFLHRDRIIDLDHLSETHPSRYPESGLRILVALKLRREAFLLWCEERGFGFPKFWRRPSDRGRSLTTINLETKCVAWIKEQAGQGERIAKPKFLLKAKLTFPRLGNRQFSRAWKRAAPVEWKQAGKIRRALGKGTLGISGNIQADQ